MVLLNFSRQFGTLFDGTLGVQFHSHIGAANHVHFHSCCFERLLQVAARQLAGADDDIVYFQ